MNKRIQELAEQAGAVEAKHITNILGDMVLVGEEEIEKFALLIVKEVLDVIDRERFEIYAPVLQRVREHFGVE